MTVGVLALQGDVRQHGAALADLGETVREVTVPGDLEGLSGIVLPGGESTTLSLLLGSSGLFGPLDEAFRQGFPVFGTCAGMILLASEVLDGRPDQRSFDLVDLEVRRNGYGRQAASFECDLEVSGAGDGDGTMHAVFIRAPVVESAGPGVEVLASLPADRVRAADPADAGGAGGAGGAGDPGDAAAAAAEWSQSADAGRPTPRRPVLCRQGSALVAAFHPELTGDRRLHRLFVDMIKEKRT